MLHCTYQNAAMQTKALSWYLVYIKLASRRTGVSATPRNQRVNMAKTASIALSPSATLFGRLVASIDRLLMAYAEMNIRNGDVPRFGL